VTFHALISLVKERFICSQGNRTSLVEEISIPQIFRIWFCSEMNTRRQGLLFRQTIALVYELRFQFCLAKLQGLLEGVNWTHRKQPVPS
jgi:hypothetical protein